MPKKRAKLRETASWSQAAQRRVRLRELMHCDGQGSAHRLHQTSLNIDLLIPYSAILAEMLRRDRPQILAQRPTLPWLFSSALRMYCCSISVLTSRSISPSGLFRSISNGILGDAGTRISDGRFSG